MNSKVLHPNQIHNYQDLYQIQIKFDRSNATYKPQETVTGNISLVSKRQEKFKVDIESLSLSVSGAITILNRQNKPDLQELSKRVPPIRILSINDMLIAKNRTLTQDTSLPFRFKLQKGQHKYVQSYIGVFITVNYNINVMVRFSQKRMLQEEVNFYVQVPKQGREVIDNFVHPKKKNFLITSQDVKGDKSKIPTFKIRGQIESEICFFNDDLHGWIMIDLAESPIRSIDIQMLRVERIQNQFKPFNEKTEIQLIQICDGNVTRNLEIPLYMILPRYYSCPSVKYLWCNLNFEVNFQIIFKDGYKVTINIPLKFIRS